MRNLRSLALLAFALVALATGCGPVKYSRRSGGGNNAFLGAYLSERVGHDMNEGRRFASTDWGRAFPILALPFKFWDGVLALGGMTLAEREYRAGMGRPCLREEYLELLKAARDAGLIQDAEFRRRVIGLPDTGFVNLATLQFMQRECPAEFSQRFGDMAPVPQSHYKGLLRKLRWERDADINPMNYGLSLKAVEVQAITEEEFRQDIFWHMLKRPVPWALEQAGVKEYIPRGRYLAELRAAVCRLDQKLAQEAYEAGLIEAPKRDEWQSAAEKQQAVVKALLHSIEKPTAK